MEWLTGKYRVRPMLMLILVGSFVAIFVLLPTFRFVGESITNTKAGQLEVSCNEQENDELLIAKAELERSRMMDAVREKRDLTNALNRLSKFSYCENTLELSLQAAEKLFGYSNHNVERIDVADALLHSLENAESGFGLNSSTRMSAIILVESYMKTVKDDKASVHEEQIVKYREVAWSLSERFQEMGYYDKSALWSEEYVKYKLFGKAPVYLEKYVKAEQKLSRSLQKISNR